jgi:hypothetical protein
MYVENPHWIKGKWWWENTPQSFPSFTHFFFGQNPIIVSVIKSIFNSYIWFSIVFNSLYPSSRTINHIFSIATSKLPELYSWWREQLQENLNWNTIVNHLSPLLTIHHHYWPILSVVQLFQVPFRSVNDAKTETAAAEAKRSDRDGLGIYVQ